MFKLRYFFLSMNVLNGLLAAAIASVVFFAVIPFLNPVVRFSPPPVKPPAALSGEKKAPPQSLSPADYAVISEQNLFHPERKVPPEKQTEKVIPKPDLFLYGTLIMDDTSIAFVEDRKAPYSTAGRGKRQRALKKGDSLSGYILSEIEANRIVLVKGEDKLVVMLDDTGKRRASEAPASQMGARTTAGGITSYPPAASSFPQAAPGSAQAAPSPGPGLGVPSTRPPSQPFVSPSPQAAASSPQSATSPGLEIGPGSRPPTRRGQIQEVQRIKAERPMSP
jgi:hypothetical protein